MPNCIIEMPYLYKNMTTLFFPDIASILILLWWELSWEKPFDWLRLILSGNVIFWELCLKRSSTWIHCFLHFYLYLEMLVTVRHSFTTLRCKLHPPTSTPCEGGQEWCQPFFECRHLISSSRSDGADQGWSYSSMTQHHHESVWWDLA